MSGCTVAWHADPAVARRSSDSCPFKLHPQAEARVAEPQSLGADYYARCLLQSLFRPTRVRAGAFCWLPGKFVRQAKDRKGRGADIGTADCSKPLTVYLVGRPKVPQADWLPCKDNQTRRRQGGRDPTRCPRFPRLSWGLSQSRAAAGLRLRGSVAALTAVAWRLGRVSLDIDRLRGREPFRGWATPLGLVVVR